MAGLITTTWKINGIENEPSTMVVEDDVNDFTSRVTFKTPYGPMEIELAVEFDPQLTPKEQEIEDEEV